MSTFNEYATQGREQGLSAAESCLWAALRTSITNGMAMPEPLNLIDHRTAWPMHTTLGSQPGELPVMRANFEWAYPF